MSNPIGDLPHHSLSRYITTALFAFYMLFLSLPLSSCRSSENGAPASDGDSEAAISNDEVLRKMYDTNYEVPAGFYKDSRADSTRSYTVYHLKDVTNAFELCSSSFEAARDWEAADNEDREIGGVYVGSAETQMYYEFIRELSYPSSVGNTSGTTSPGYARVFKCDYVNRDGVDRSIRNGYAGTLNIRPLEKSQLADYVEYLWQFTYFQPAQKKVLDTTQHEDATSIRHNLLLGLLTDQGSDRCNLIEVVEWSFDLSKESSQITKQFKLLRSFEAQQDAGAGTICNE